MAKCFEPHPMYPHAKCNRTEHHDGPHKLELKWERIKPPIRSTLFTDFAHDNYFKWCTCQHTAKVHRKERECKVGNCQCATFTQMTVEQFTRWRTR